MTDSWSGKSFCMWVIYSNPSDFPPGTFVARKWIDNKPSLSFKKSNDIEILRSDLNERGLVRLERHQFDDPVITEVWI